MARLSPPHWAAITTTPTGLTTLIPLSASLPATLWISKGLATHPLARVEAVEIEIYEDSLADLVGQLWSRYDGLIFALATGAVVRLIAPLLQHKSLDPAVVVVEERGRQVISLCGGHQGGADRLTGQIAQLIGADPILTGSAQAQNLPALDLLGEPFGWHRGAGDWTALSGAIAAGQAVTVFQDCGSTLWQQHLPADHPFLFTASPTPPQAQLWISASPHQFAGDPSWPVVQWHPRVLWVGVGCERGTPRSVIAAGIDQVCQAHGLAPEAIAGVASLDLKADEQGLVDLCQERGWPLRCFSAAELRQVAVPNPSALVEAVVETPSVAEAAAMLAANADLRLPKQVVRLQGQPGAVTLAIAQASQEYIDHPGHLFLVGLGPGSLDQITPAARRTILEADAVIGYSLYIDQIRPLCRPGQILESWPLTQERQRAERAIDLARWGLGVAVVSSGDCGIYGMAGLVLERLHASGWDGVRPGVEVLPGISALQAAAARVGAPLMHDFCAISLSDLLTPWSVIVKRLEAAAQADFVTAIYNPKSQNRTHQIEAAQRIFMEWRSPQTPVAIVRSAYRPGETLQTTTLENLPIAAIDMMTIVLIGNQSTQQTDSWIFTPRGYQDKAIG
ncbi:MAG: precorrin-3B C(17)-methyltransferase [Cyanobacteria bacterium REEB459]|nr:precorrin-3B C(17)-methyltransferase [Cyanobacteria bacterium REEB459]